MADAAPLLNTGNYSTNQVGGQVYGSATGTGALRTASIEPDGYELTRAGKRFAFGVSAAITGIAPVQAMPTTAAQWALTNTSLTKSVVFDSLGVILNSGTAGAGINVIVAPFTTPAQTGVLAGMTIANKSNSSVASVLSVKTGVTITAPTAPAWYLLASNVNAATAVLSAAAMNMDIRGRIIIPPGQSLGLCVLSPAGTVPLYVPQGDWFEMEITLV